MEMPKGIVGRLHQSVSNSPIICFVLGGASLFLGIAATLVDIRTTENLMIGADPSSLLISWEILMQPKDMLFGGLPITLEMAYVSGWGVELVQLIYGIGLTIALRKLHSISPTLAKWFGIFGLILLAMNAIANFKSAPTSSPLMSAIMAIIIGGLAIVGLPLGIGFIEHAFGEI